MFIIRFSIVLFITHCKVKISIVYVSRVSTLINKPDTLTNYLQKNLLESIV